jgi:hypothetical protein
MHALFAAEVQSHVAWGEQKASLSRINREPGLSRAANRSLEDEVHGFGTSI